MENILLKKEQKTDFENFFFFCWSISKVLGIIKERKEWVCDGGARYREEDFLCKRVRLWVE
jgi:hypothetical protein